MNRPQTPGGAVPLKQSHNNNRPGRTSAILDSGTVTVAATNGAGVGSHHPNTEHRRTSRPLTRHKVECVVTKPDVSPEFLQCLKTLTKRDFEHAHTSSEAERDPPKLDMINSTNTYIPPARSLLRKAGQTEGFKFFYQNSPSATANTYTRPVTVDPEFPVQKGDADEQGLSLGKNILRPVSAYTPSSGGKSRPLVKSKAVLAQVGGLTYCEGEIDVCEVDRPLSATNNEYDNSYNSASDSERPDSACSAKRVTFAADVVNYERENKPSKRRKMPKRRRQGFPHPSRGIFIPPEAETVESAGPSGICRDNPYLNFNQVWTHPQARTTGESNGSQQVRQERFHRLMSDLEHAHIHYNRLTNIKQNDYLTQCIFKRYILVLDLALTEGHLNQVEHLLETISKSVPVLHQNTFFYLYGSKVIAEEGNAKGDKLSEVHNEKPDLILTRYALSRISGNLHRQDCSKMSIETVLVKLSLELVEVVFSAFGSLEYRNALHTLPYTVRQAINLLKDLKNSKDTFCYIKWINNSAVQRDFRSVLKNLGLLDKYGSKSEFPTPEFPGVANNGSRGKRTSSAGNSSSGNGKQSKATSPVSLRSRNGSS